jgi:AAA domain
MTAYERLLDRLRDGRTIKDDRPGRHAWVQCPLPGHQHGDRHPSLSVTSIEGGILLWCHCSQDRTYKAIGDWLGWSAGQLLHDDPSGEMVYRYSDGRRVHRRYDDGRKRFTQRGNTNGRRSVLFHLERIEEARAKGEPIMLVGSEKDVLALEAIGAYATCAPMGEGNLDKVDHTPLHGLQVIGIVHNDEAGEKWAHSVLAALDGKAQSVDFTKAAIGLEHADAADHIAAGYTLAELVPWSPPELSGDDLLASEVEFAAHRMRVREMARQKLAQEAAGELRLPTMIRLTDFLAQPDPPRKYLIEPIWTEGGRVLFSAQWKTGKSTARDNAVRSVADGEPFLGVFKVQPIAEGTIVVFDDELHPDMMRRWLRDQGITNTDRVVVVPMRGRVGAFDLTLPAVRAMWAQRLRNVGAAIVLLDCLRPILDALGLSEDKEAGRFLVAFDQMLDEAEIGPAMIVHHMGHANERARGDSRILDWGDQLWKLVRDDSDDSIPIEERARYFTAFGRDVNVRESRLSYDQITRRLSITGGTRRESKGEEAWPAVRAFIEDNPDCSANRIEKHLVPTYSKEAVRAAIEAAEKRSDIHIERTGKGLANLHRLKEPAVVEAAQPTIEEATSPTSPDLATANPRTPPRHLATSLIGRGGGGGTEEADGLTPAGEVSPVPEGDQTR